MAMTADNRLFVDTNVLIYATDVRSPFHVKAQAALNAARSQGITLVISQQVLREYLAVVTRPSLGVPEVPLAQVVENIRIMQREFDVVADSAQVLNNLLELLNRVEVRGKQMHDANIVATMLAYDIHHLLTHNISDFARFSQLITVTDI
jgi:predicted nucleic acid-binding protein